MGAAITVAGMIARRRVEKRMVINACDESEETSDYAHSVSKPSKNETNECCLLGFGKRLVDE